MGLSTRTTIRALILSLAVLAGTARAATVLTLSDLSSDETSPSVLNATLVYAVLGDELTLTVTNDTPGVGGFDINAVYLNAGSHVADLLPSSAVPEWTLLQGEAADGFGTFDYAVIDGTGNDEAEIGPGESLAFTFQILGTGPFAETDFTTEFSVIPPGPHPALAAAKFVSGPGDDSAFGAVIPEPSTGLLALIGICLFGRTRRR